MSTLIRSGETLFPFLLEVALKVTALAVIVLGLALVLGRKRLLARYWLGVYCLVGMLILPLTSFIAGSGRVSLLPAQWHTAVVGAEARLPQPESDVDRRSLPSEVQGYPGETRNTMGSYFAERAESEATLLALMDVDAPAAPSVAEAAMKQHAVAPEGLSPDMHQPDSTLTSTDPSGSAATETDTASLSSTRGPSQANPQSISFALPWRGVIGVMWAAGCALMLLRLLASAVSVARMSRGASRVSDPDLLELFAKARKGAGVTRGAVLRTGKNVPSPVAIGIFRPSILLPESLHRNMPPQHLRPILIHELAHVQLGDYAVNILQRIAESLLFFHPLLWFISLRLRRLREEICDNWVLERYSDGTVYAKALMELAGQAMHLRRRRYGAMGLYSHYARIRSRIERILSSAKRPAMVFRLKTALILLCVSAAIVGSLSFASLSARAVQEETATAEEESKQPVIVEGEELTKVSFMKTIGRYARYELPPLPVLLMNDGRAMVPAQRIWSDTGVNLEEGQIVSVSAAGQVRGCNQPPTSWAFGPWGPEGTMCGEPEYTDKKACALIGKIEAGSGRKEFYIGKDLTFKAPLTGTFYLGVADPFHMDNEAAFVAEVKVDGKAVDFRTIFGTKASGEAEAGSPITATSVRAAEAFDLDALPGRRVFRGTYNHRSRRQPYGTSEQWLVEGDEGALTVVTKLRSYTYVAVGDKEHRVVEYKILPEQESDYKGELAIEEGKVIFRQRMPGEAEKTYEIEVPEGSLFDPNTRPDPYCATVILLKHLTLKEGESKEVLAYDRDNAGTGMATYRFRIQNKGKENVTVPAGEFEANHLMLQQLTTGDTWYKKRAIHVTDFWVLDNGAIVKIFRHREPYEVELQATQEADSRFSTDQPVAGTKTPTERSAPKLKVTVPKQPVRVEEYELYSGSFRVQPEAGANYVVRPGAFRNGNRLYTDRNYTLLGVPEKYHGLTYIQALQDDKEASRDFSLTFEVNVPVTVYVGRDDRLETKPAWLQEFEDTGDDFSSSDPWEPVFSIYAKRYPKGEITLGPNCGVMLSCMYLVILEELPEGTEAEQVALPRPKEEVTPARPVTAEGAYLPGRASSETASPTNTERTVPPERAASAPTAAPVREGYAQGINGVRFMKTLPMYRRQELPPMPVLSMDDGRAIVPAQRIWSDTGLDVEQGQSIEFSTDGQVRGCHAPMGDWAMGPWGPEGTLSQGSAYYGNRVCALIGKIESEGDVKEFYVGKELTLSAPLSGRLYLGVSDIFHIDNEGAFVVDVKVDRKRVDFRAIKPSEVAAAKPKPAPAPELRREELAFIDLDPYVNSGLRGLQSMQGNDLLLDPGEQSIADTIFRIGSGVIQLRGPILDEWAPGRFPQEVKGIKVGLKFGKLHILHATGWGAGPHPIADGSHIGNYVIRYEDESTQEIPIKYGNHVRDWWTTYGDVPDVSEGKTAPIRGSRRLFTLTWENPHPDRVVTTIDYTSTGTVCAPFLVAMAAETDQGAPAVAEVSPRERVSPAAPSVAEAPIRVLRHTSPVHSVGFSPDGSAIVTGAADGKVRLWNVETGEEIRTFSGHSGAVHSVAFSSDGVLIVAGSWDNTAKLWKQATGEEIRTFSGHTHYVEQVAFSRDTTKILTASYDATAKLWDTATGKEIRTFSGHGDRVDWAAFSPDESKVLTGSYDGTAKLWDAETGEEIRTFSGHTRAVCSVAFSPDGRTIATAGRDTTAKLWDVETGQEIRTFTGHSNWIWSVVFSPDGAMVLTGSMDGTARLWDAESGKEIATLTGHRGPIDQAAFSPDGRKVATASLDGLVLLWDVEGLVSAAARPKPAPAAETTGEGLAFIDLDPYLNSGLQGLQSMQGNDLRLNPGEQRVADTIFRIGNGVIQLRGPILDEWAPGRFPREVKGIKVGLNFKKLHILHATGWGAGPHPIADGSHIGDYVIHYEDESTQEIPIKYGNHVRDWWTTYGDATEVSEGKTAPIRGSRRLFTMSWENPHPDRTLTTIDYTSTGTVCAPFLVAMAAETDEGVPAVEETRPALPRKFGKKVVVAPDGSGDTTSIQEAIDGVDEHGTVSIKAGTYREHLVISKPVSIGGAGRDVTRIETTSNQPGISVQRCNDVGIKGLTITCGTSLGEQSGLILMDVQDAALSVEECNLLWAQFGIRISGNSNARIEKCLVAGIWGTGVAIGSDASAIVANCEVRNCYHRCITVRTKGEVRIENNLISGSAWHGIRYDHCSPVIVGNILNNHARFGIYASGSGEAQIINNLFLRNDMSGVSTWGRTNPVIRNNTFARNERGGLEMDITTCPVVENNIFFGEKVGAVRFFTSGSRGFKDANPPQLSHNLLWQNEEEGRDVSFSGTALRVDPLFVDAEADNYNLRPDSPALGAGKDGADIGAKLTISVKSQYPITPEEKLIIPNSDSRDFQLWKTGVKSPPTRKSVAGAAPAAETTAEGLAFIDLGPHVNTSLKGWHGVPGNDITLEPGVQRLGDSTFRIGDGAIELAGTIYKGMQPDKVEGIEIGLKFQKLHILHATGWGAGRESYAVPHGTHIGTYSIRYEDGSTEEIAIGYGVHVRDWWAREDDPSEVSDGKVAWKGKADYPWEHERATTRLYSMTWQNPHPHKVVSTIDFSSTGTICAPFVVAMTAEAATMAPTVEVKEVKTEPLRDKGYEKAFRDLHDELGRNYPAFGIKGIDWNKVGEELLPRAKEVKTDHEFGLLCLELAARLEDSHAYLMNGTAQVPSVEFPRYDPGFACLIDDRGKPVVYYVDRGGPAEKAGVNVGMTVVSINGEDAEEHMQRRMNEIKKYSGYSSDRYLQYHAAQWLGRQMEQGAAVMLEMEDTDGKKHSLEVPATLGVRYLPRLPVPIPGISDSASVSWKMLEDDVGYIYVRRIKSDLIGNLDRAVETLKNARGLIVDVRGNSGGGFDASRALLNFSLDGNLEPQRPRFKGPIALLIDARCISAGEGWASWFIANERARVFGETTAGASSRKTVYTLTNGLFKVQYPVKAYTGFLDRPIERRGLEPDVPLKQNANDLAAGRDTVLEAAKGDLLEQPPDYKATGPSTPAETVEAPVTVTKGEEYSPPDFEGFFPDDPEGARKLDAMGEDGVFRSTLPDEVLLEIVRKGLRRTRQRWILRAFGNRYIWGKYPQNPKAIEIMYHATDGPDMSNAVYFGLSVVVDKSSSILRALVDICMRSEDPNVLSRIAWGTKSQTSEILPYLAPYLNAEDEATWEKARIVEKILKGEVKAFAWSAEKAKARAEKEFTDKLPEIKEKLLHGDSEARGEVLNLINRNAIALIMDDSFIEAWKACAADPDWKIRNQVARTFGGHWIWNSPEQKPEAIELMLQLSRDEVREVRYNSVYFGLSTVRDKSEEVVRRLLEIAMEDREWNMFHRIQWGLSGNKSTAAKILEDYMDQKETNPKLALAAFNTYQDIVEKPPPHPERFQQ